MMRKRRNKVLAIVLCGGLMAGILGGCGAWQEEQGRHQRVRIVPVCKLGLRTRKTHQHKHGSDRRNASAPAHRDLRCEITEKT